MAKKPASSNAVAPWSPPFAPAPPSAKRPAASTSVSRRFKPGSNAPTDNAWIVSIGRIGLAALTNHPDGRPRTWRSLS
jgi:hypothetical protein